MAQLQEEQNTFVRGQNEQAIPESMCIACFHTMIARSMETLEHLEHDHSCREMVSTLKDRRTSTPLRSNVIAPCRGRQARSAFSLLSIEVTTIRAWSRTIAGRLWTAATSWVLD
jgi:hypothetical protein